MTVNKTSFFIYQLSVIALYVIYRRGKRYHHLANNDIEARSVGLVWGHSGASNWKCDSSRPILANVNCLMVLALSYLSQHLQGALVHKQVFYLKITFHERWALTAYVTWTEMWLVSCCVTPLLFDQLLLLVEFVITLTGDCWFLLNVLITHRGTAGIRLWRAVIYPRKARPTSW